MIKVTFIIPYDEIKDEVYSLLSEVNEEDIVMDTTQIIGTQEAFLKDCTSDIIIARGVTYLALKKNMPNMSVIEIAVTGYDVIRAIDECKRKYKPKKIAVIGMESMTYGADSLKEIMGVEIESFKIENEEEALRAIEIAEQRGADAIVSGLMTYNMAKAMGKNCVWIYTGKEAVRQAIKEAVNAARVVRNERTKSELFTIILENAKEAIVAVDREGKITAFNKAAYKALNMPTAKKVNGYEISRVMPGLELSKVIKNGEEEAGIIDTINDTAIISTRVPIKAGTYKAGAVITFQNIDRIQEIESKIRKEMSSKGLVAKYSFGNIVGNSAILNKTIQTAFKYSQVDSNILIIGETGTGKELFAQSIHNASSRRLEPFVAVNCAALPENLLESELFGYVEGAFSGAIKGGKQGLFELAHKGTIFLDEVSEIPINLQAKLLRVLQEREIRKIGDHRVIPIDVRIVCASNIDLEERVREGKFRQDVLYRLNVLNLRIPALRERSEDTELIAKHFIEKYCRKFGKFIPELTCDAVKALSSYSWPGNIRELRNICERLVVFSEEEYITHQEVQELLNINDSVNNIVPKEADVNAEDDIEIMLKLMKSMSLNKTEVAKILGISRTTLWRRLKEDK
ncbi:sigma 54-interacting transcriptional regulator [Clostridium swellfunianum]|uniref:sigma 54-interacting transcriptional regulator n=1 Tax=Clostridium swellfunianum TaxID=1367462 RepID=UPI002030F8B9|nr:sigma 54-interacting transcriptional regulator [Clostridium swellfunianum]MCM0650930.1 sigma 54-interacting transcriptional regulator [Clostridium swellfunianum]